MTNLKELCNFLVTAKKSTYAAWDGAEKIVNDDKSTTLVFEDWDWRYHDNYFGGEPYGGREVVFFRNQPVYIMTYYGWVDESVTDINEVYKVLQNALSIIPEDKPFRGPDVYLWDNLMYKNSHTGEIDNFSWEEIIRDRDWKEFYKAKYIGGLVDVRK